jgi:tetratricopeptide (TPR) repeat protein
MHRGSFEKALRHLKLAIDKGNDPAWYHDMAALCHLAKGRVDEAKASYTRLLKEVEPIDGTMRCRLAMAATLTGDRKGARHWISAARQDPTTRSVDRYSAEALLAFASGKPDEGATLFAEAVRATRSEMALDDIVRDMKLREKAVPGDDQERAERREKLRQELDRVVAPHRHWITHHTPTGDSELEVKLEKDDPEIAGADLDVRTAALLAIRARRATAERPEQACQDYRRLRGSRFGPEAAIALGRVLERVGTQSARQGDTATAEAIGHELAELRSEIPVTAALQASSVLEAAGRPTDAHRRLHVSEGEVSPTGVVRLGQRAAALAIAAGKPGEAEKDLRATVESARAESDHSRVAQTEVRLALTALASDDQARASAHMEEAIEAWRRAGALQPTAALLGELTGLAKRSTRWKALAERALEILGVDSSAGVAPVDIQGVADVAQKLARHTSQ